MIEQAVASGDQLPREPQKEAGDSGAARSTARASSRWGFLAVVDERLGLQGVRYPVPRHSNGLAYSLGGVTLGAFVLLALSGFYLTQYYEPGTETARASVQHLVTAVTLGSFLRGIHYWAAMAMVVLLGLHLVRVFVTGAFKRPREATWLLGVALVGIVGLFFVSGTILKWDQEAFEAFDHSIELGGVLGRFLGFWLEPTFGAPMLLRLYTVHVAILPLLFAAVLAGHLLLVKHHGLAPSPFYRGPQPEPTVPFSSHIGRLAGLTAIVAGIASVLAVLSPPGLGPAPVEGLEVTKPPWPILWWYAVENLVGVSGILWATLVVLVALVVTPFVDRGTERHPWKRLPVLISAAILVAAVVALTLYALLAPVKPHIEM